MVTVIDFELRITDEGKNFYALTIQGGIEVVQSKNGNLYMTARKMSIPSTFDERGCQHILGKELPGEIKKVDCKPYEYVNKKTGEVIMLSHTYEYISEEKQDLKLGNIPEFIPLGINEEIPIGVES